jgi:hypothetical protein
MCASNPDRLFSRVDVGNDHYRDYEIEDFEKRRDDDVDDDDDENNTGLLVQCSVYGRNTLTMNFVAQHCMD